MEIIAVRWRFDFLAQTKKQKRKNFGGAGSAAASQTSFKIRLWLPIRTTMFLGVQRTAEASKESISDILKRVDLKTNSLSVENKTKAVSNSELRKNVAKACVGLLSRDKSVEYEYVVTIRKALSSELCYTELVSHFSNAPLTFALVCS